MDTLFEKYGLFDAVGIWSSVKADAKAESHFFLNTKTQCKPHLVVLH